MPRLIDDDTVDSYKRVGLLPRDKQVYAEVEKKEPTVVNVTIQQDNSEMNSAITALLDHSRREIPKKLEQWEFIVQRDSDGNMIKILAKQTE